MGSNAKICVICGEDCAGRPRIKDPAGRYCHQECRERVKREQDARHTAVFGAPTVPPEGPDTIGLPKEITDEPAGVRCPSCGVLLAGSTVICMNCGFNVQSGHAAKVKVKKTKTPCEARVLAQEVTAILFQPFVISMVILAVLLVLLLVFVSGGAGWFHE